MRLDPEFGNVTFERLRIEYGKHDDEGDRLTPAQLEEHWKGLKVVKPGPIVSAPALAQLPEDLRVLPVHFERDGRRFRLLAEAEPDYEEEVTDDWPFDGDRGLAHAGRTLRRENRPGSITMRIGLPSRVCGSMTGASTSTRCFVMLYIVELSTISCRSSTWRHWRRSTSGVN